MRRYVLAALRSGPVWLVALIVINLAYTGWGWSLERAGDEPRAMGLAPLDPPLRLLAELPADEIRLIDAASGDRDLSAGAGMICKSWGPFTDADELRAVETQVAALGGSTVIHHTTVSGDPDYLVYVGDRGRAENVRRLLDELQSQSVDAYLIMRGEYNNTVSVGVFSRPDRAESQRRRVGELGYDTSVEEIDRSYDEYRLEALVPEDYDGPTDYRGVPCGQIAQAH